MLSRIITINPKYTERNIDSLEEYETKGKAPKKENLCRKYNIFENQFVCDNIYVNLNVKRNINIDDNLNIQKRAIPKKDDGYNNCLKIKEIEDNEINEKKISGSKMIPLNPILDTCKSICKIKTLDSQGSGFLIKLQKRNEDFFCLMTNEHVVTKSMIENENTIKVYYDNEKEKVKIKLNPNERIIEIFTYLDIDLCVVEILFKDRISTEFFYCHQFLI